MCWVPFNEAWGQFDTVGVTESEQRRRCNPSRLVNCASGGNDFPTGDISDLHRYPGPTIPALEEKRVGSSSNLSIYSKSGSHLAVGEKLGLSIAYHEGRPQRRLRGVNQAITSTDRQGAFGSRLYADDRCRSRSGLLTYDREVLKFDMQKTAALSKLLFTPAPQEIVVVPTAVEKAQTWRYTTEKPADGWQGADFDDCQWKEGDGGFGEASTPGSKVRTAWKTNDIWMRRTIELPSGPTDGMSINIHHDEDAEVYINGVQALAMRGYITDYVAQPLDAKGLAALKPGKNVIAVHCRQTGGGQYIDVGISRLVEKTK